MYFDAKAYGVRTIPTLVMGKNFVSIRIQTLHKMDKYLLHSHHGSNHDREYNHYCYSFFLDFLHQPMKMSKLDNQFFGRNFCMFLNLILTVFQIDEMKNVIHQIVLSIYDIFYRRIWNKQKQNFNQI